jgi:hypothetical protein
MRIPTRNGNQSQTRSNWFKLRRLRRDRPKFPLAPGGGIPLPLSVGRWGQTQCAGVSIEIVYNR